MSDDRTLTEARARMMALAQGLVVVLGPVDAAGVLLGAGTAVLTEAYDKEMAVRYLREVADELEADDSEPVVGHA